MDNPQAYLGRLKSIHLFKGLNDDQILAIAKELTQESHPANEVIFNEGDEGQLFYIIEKGTVKVTRRRGGEDRLVAKLVTGDFFGEAALIYGRRRSATITAETEVKLLALSREDFDNLLRGNAQIRPNLLVSAESRKLYEHLKFSWLTPDEVVYLIARRHPILMWQRQLAPVGIAALALLLAAFVGYTYDLGLAGWCLLIGAVFAVPWFIWNYADWGNDFYIVTNQRIVYLEKVALIYDSRQEAPLASVMAVAVQTANATERMLGVGDVVVRTFSGPITFKSVPNPAAMAALVEEHWLRTKSRQREAEHTAMQETIRRRLRPAPTPEKKPPPPPPKPPTALTKAREHFSFKVRLDQGNTITYRKHWWVLLTGTWKPLALVLADIVMVVLFLVIIPNSIFSGPVVILVAFVVFIPLFGWWLYQYEDWRNDIYQVTPDQIVDVYKKPLGAESRKAAPLGNIMSLRYERPGVLGLMLNFGNVVASVAAQEFRFDGVYDPVGVQNDIYRRMEALKAQAGKTEADKRREEISEWLGVYYKVTKEMEAEERQQPAASTPPPLPNKDRY
jgi:hypothetical protein